MARRLLVRLLTLITSFNEVTDVVVISADPELRAIAHSFGYHSLPDPKLDPSTPLIKTNLNPSLEAGRDYALAHGAKSLLVLPTDLPKLSKEALKRFFHLTTSIALHSFAG